MFSDRTCISHLGLPPREATVLRSLFQLVPALQESFDLVETKYAERADVVFVNTADLPAVKAWQDVAQRNQLAIPVLVVDSDDQSDDELKVRRPLVLKKLLDVLQKVTSTQTASRQRGAGEFRILVVDDSFPVRKYLEHNLPRLAPAPISISLAESAADAQNKLGNQHFDLVFLDVVMPDMDGYKLCKWVKSHNKFIPVVMLTSRSGSFDKVRAAVAGCDAFLIKPPEDEKVRETLVRFMPAEAARTLETA
jgi:twitching motility two-component system response regulator PilG